MLSKDIANFNVKFKKSFTTQEYLRSYAAQRCSALVTPLSNSYATQQYVTLLSSAYMTQKCEYDSAMLRIAKV